MGLVAPGGRREEEEGEEGALGAVLMAREYLRAWKSSLTLSQTAQGARAERGVTHPSGERGTGAAGSPSSLSFIAAG